jgi:hydroxymethylglutaryl-CoA lyase
VVELSGSTAGRLPAVLVREVGLRDGLQMIGTFLPTHHKKEWIDRCVACGIREIDVCSFVPAKYIPQFQDSEDVAAHAVGKVGLAAAALVPNLRGAERALAAGVDKLICITSATETFSRANLRRSRAQSLDELKSIVRLRDEHAGMNRRASIQVGISVAFGCPFEGKVPERDVYSSAIAAVEAGADEISLADTAGQGDPAQVRRIFGTLSHELRNVPLAAHFHDTRGTGLANVLAALDEQVRSFDASIAGLGGCPNSPGAKGNIATEDLVYMLEAMGLDTSIDVARLLELRKFVGECLPGTSLFGHIGQVGLPKGFVPAASAKSEPTK